MEITLLGISIDVSELQYPNAYSPIFVTLSEIVTLVRLVQL